MNIHTLSDLVERIMHFDIPAFFEPLGSITLGEVFASATDPVVFFPVVAFLVGRFISAKQYVRRSEVNVNHYRSHPTPPVPSVNNARIEDDY